MGHLNLKEITKKYPWEKGMILVILSGRGWGKTEKVKELALEDFEKGYGIFQWVVNHEDALKEEKDNFLAGLQKRQNELGEKFFFNINDFEMDGSKVYRIYKEITTDKDGKETINVKKELAGKLIMLVNLSTKGSRRKTAHFIYDEFNDGIPRIHKQFQFKWWWKKFITLTEGDSPPKVSLLGNNENNNTEITIRLGLDKVKVGITYDEEMLVIKDDRDMTELFGGENAKVVKLAKRFGVWESTFSTEYAGIERLNVVDLNYKKMKYVIGLSTSKNDESFIVSIYSGYIGDNHIYYAVSEDYRSVFNDKNRGQEWISKNCIGIAQIKGNEDFKVINKKVKENFKETFRKISNNGEMYFKYERCRELFNDEVFK